MPKIEPFEKNTMEYEDWFETNRAVYLSELKAVRQLLPVQGTGIEIGVGTGRFAGPLGIAFGIEPSTNMGRIARQRGVHVMRGIGELLPLAESRFDFALMVTTLCFLSDAEGAFREVYRILKDNGAFIIGFIDKDSPIGRNYMNHKEKSKFYSAATFYSAQEVNQLLQRTGFRETTTIQTIFHPFAETRADETVKPGYGEGSFLVIKGVK